MRLRWDTCLGAAEKSRCNPEAGRPIFFRLPGTAQSGSAGCEPWRASTDVALYQQKEFDNVYPEYEKYKSSIETEEEAFVIACDLEELGEAYKHTNREISIAKYKEAFQILDRPLPYSEAPSKTEKEVVEKTKASQRAKIAELEQKTE